MVEMDCLVYKEKKVKFYQNIFINIIIQTKKHKNLSDISNGKMFLYAKLDTELKLTALLCVLHGTTCFCFFKFFTYLNDYNF